VTEMRSVGHVVGQSVGRSVRRVDAALKVTGQARYPADYSMAGMRHAKVVWAGEPHARILDLDLSAALALPGVVAVLTSRDVPCNEYGIIDSDQQVLAADVVRWTGEAVAVVVAETEELAERARDLVRVTYQPLPLLLDPLQALDPGAPRIHAGLASNLLGSWKVRRGDAEAALGEADLVIEAEYRVPFVEHAYLQPEAALGYLDEAGRVTVVAAAQWPQDDIRQIAHALGLPEDRTREIVPSIGGAFGGREDISLQILVALAAWKTRGPVKMVWTREESMRCHGKRHPFTMRYRWGAKDGRLTAAKVELIADAGAYSSTSKAVVPGALSVAVGPYNIPNVAVDACVVHTNNPPTMAMRGFGTAQPPVAYEQQMDKFARALGEDPVSFRLKHLWDEGSVQPTGATVPPGVGVKETLRQAALAIGWRPAGERWVRPELPPLPDGRRRGVGLATAFKNVGYSFGFHDCSTARVTVDLDERGEPRQAEVFSAAAEVGMGVHTVLVQMAAQELGLPVERVKFHPVDTSETPNAGSSSASRHTFISGNAVLAACRQALAKRSPGARRVEGEFAYDSQNARPTTGLNPETGAGNPHIAYGYATQAAEVAVDPVTGVVEVLRMVSSQDVGRAMNPQMIEGQVGGGVGMGLGYALMEEFKLRDDGRVRTRNFSEYLIPTTMDMPSELQSITVEVPDPAGPYGAKGVGEHVMLPTAPAVLNAIRDAVGVDIDQLPAGPERVWRALSGAERARSGAERTRSASTSARKGAPE
jgi:CO/xanthine dehydrogenase Mo-binding subunit